MIAVFWHQVQLAYNKLLDVCFNLSIRNYIIFNPVKSICVAVQPRKRKLFCPNVTLDNNVLENVNQTKYLGFMSNSNAQDDEDMLKQMRNLYIRSNKLLCTFHYCSTDVKLELFKSYCTSFYCPGLCVMIFRIFGKKTLFIAPAT